jgi:hypothetical protein
VGVQVPHPGVDMELNPKEFKYHKYYQWVCFVLFFQSTLFYIPRWLWKMWEGGKIQALMMDLDVGVCSEMEKKQKKKLLVDYLYNSRGHHDWYAARYFFCEILALGNVVGQMFMLDKFFDGEFLTYGLQVIEFSQMDQGQSHAHSQLMSFSFHSISAFILRIIISLIKGTLSVLEVC